MRHEIIKARDRDCQLFPRVCKLAARVVNTLRAIGMGQSAGNIADDFIKYLRGDVHPPLGSLKLVQQNFMYAFMIHGRATQNFGIRPLSSSMIFQSGVKGAAAACRLAPITNDLVCIWDKFT